MQRITVKADEGMLFVFGEDFVEHLSLPSAEDKSKYQQVSIEEVERIKAEREIIGGEQDI